ncbi:DNA mismatch repair endonuclease MutL [Maridesulfovibrio sp.]|uniref:DNA mismatch repair endonuclease MutL n=1 Tax=Maridesulfovibrio sp. TaxID=2795000 RepID=UPI0029F46BE0|nr:DNA mismatch repair endonuclease MutL [Maridesulfovibrio sp.]
MSTPEIHVLPASLRNQIAAGEVVERPSSVVKELVENSIDAGCTQVDVAVERGGQGYISVKDNGRGIAANELKLAVTRHATSKISNIDDLSAITSFGFRGEALPSIASVSRFKMSSFRKGADEGWSINVEGGTVIEEGPAAIPSGTAVEVRDLFYNVPARLKFLKTESTEARRCNQVMFKMALANVQAGFSFISNGREQFRLPAGQTLPERLSVFWPRNICESLLEFSHEAGEMKVHGCAGIPALAQARGDRIIMFVNGRPVQDKLLLSAIRGAYKGRLISREYPQAVLFLELPPSLVDVNVHPAKMEVRFQDEKAVFGVIRNGIGQALSRYELGIVEGDTPLVNSPEVPIRHSKQEKKLSESVYLPIEPAAKFSSWNEFKNTDFTALNDDETPITHSSFLPESAASSVAEKRMEPDMMHEQTMDYSTQKVSEYPQFSQDQHPQQASQHHPSAAGAIYVPGSRIEYLGQVADTYLVLKLPNGSLGLLDQHAAHERVIYENMRNLRTRGESRPLALPIDIALHPSEVQRVQEMWEELHAAGFMLELEAGQTLSMRGIPPGLETGEAREYLKAAVDGQAKTLDDLWIMLSCKSAIKANLALAVDEALSLLEAWVKCPQREYCPHGRPVLVSWSALEMEKLFKRK